MNKNILICLNKLDIGGIETAVINQASEFIDRGYKVIILAKSGIYTNTLEDKGAICIDFDFELKDGYDLEKSKLIEKIIEEYNITQVHIHQFDCIPSIFPACINTNTKYIAYIHTGVIGTYDWFEEHYVSYKSIFNMYYNMAYKIVAITESAKNENKYKYNVDDEKYIIINNSIRFTENITNNTIPNKIENFLIISRFSEVKRNSIKNAINIFRQYKKNHIEATLTIVGSGEDEKFILNEINDINDSVNMIGAKNNILEVMNNYDIVIALDRCILEAIATKRIAIISGYEKVRDMITPENIKLASNENFSGRNIEEKEISEIVKEIECLDSEKITNIVNENYEFAYENLNIRKNVYLIEEDDKEDINIDKKRYFENINNFIEKIKMSIEQANKIYADSKEAQNYFEKQIDIRDKQIEVLKQEFEKIKKDYSDIKNQMDEIYNSRSCKYTSEVKGVFNIFKRKKS